MKKRSVLSIGLSFLMTVFMSIPAEAGPDLMTIQGATTADLLSVLQGGTGIAVDAESYGGISIRSIAVGTNGTGVAGICFADGGTGVIGLGAGKGLWGQSDGDDGVGVYAYSRYGKAIDAVTSEDSTGEWTPAILGENYGAGDGVYGWSQNRHGVVGVSYSDNAAIWAANNNSGPAILAEGGSDGTAIKIINGGIKFPDGTIQTTAPAPTWHQILPAAERFELVMGGAAVLDKETGLVWEQSPDPGPDSWYMATFICYSKEAGSRMGWRMPTIEELSSLVDNDNSNPTLPTGHPFNVLSFYYWSSTTYGPVPSEAFLVGFNDGHVVTADKSYDAAYVWCVRGGHGYDGI